MVERVVDEEKLENLYQAALAHEKSGHFAEASEYYRQMLTLDPSDHAGAAVRLAAMECGPTPPAAPAAYIATLFNQHAEVFDLILVDRLGYDVPQQLRAYLESWAPERRFSHLLDLGCGTGLCGEVLDELVDHKTGIDLAENMIAMAHEKGDYDKLWVGDIEQFLREAGATKWDIITATDVLPYMGDIEAFFVSVGEHLEEEGIFAFSSEILSELQFGSAAYKVGPFQRFAHQTSYIEVCLRRAGLTILHKYDIVVRQEQDSDVHGQLFFSIK